MTERFDKLLSKREQAIKVRKKQRLSVPRIASGSINRFLHDEPIKKGNTERALPSVKIKSNAYEIVYKYDKRKELTIGQEYEIWARDYGHFFAVCVWKDIKRDGAEFRMDNGSHRNVRLTKTTYIPVKK